MGLSYQRHIKLSKHCNLNLSKSGLGVSGGIKGLRVAVGLMGVRVSSSANGLNYRKTIGWKKIIKLLTK
jgi:hypothetical protein